MIRNLHPAARLSGSFHLPGDKSISHRYAMLAAIADGPSELRHYGSSLDCQSTLDCLRALGVRIETSGDTVSIVGRGLDGLTPSGLPLDAGNSGTTMRLLSGILAGHPFTTTVSGDSSLKSRPMNRILDPLRLMGAAVGSRDGGLPPLEIRGGRLKGLRYTMPVASAQVKSCLLLAGLYASGPTAIEERTQTRDHTEIALQHFGASLEIDRGWIELQPRPHLRGMELEVPGDLSSAAFFIVAAALVPDSDVCLLGVGLNGRRRELVKYLQEAGVALSVQNERAAAGEMRGDIRVSFTPRLFAGSLPPIRGSRVAALIDEIPVLAVLGSQATNGLEVSEAAELRVKESDRLSAIASGLRAMNVHVTELRDGLRVPGGQQLRGASIETHGDHRIAMAFAIAGLLADGETEIRRAECVDVSFPGFFEQLEAARN